MSDSDRTRRENEAFQASVGWSAGIRGATPGVRQRQQDSENALGGGRDFLYGTSSGTSFSPPSDGAGAGILIFLLIAAGAGLLAAGVYPLWIAYQFVEWVVSYSAPWLGKFVSPRWILSKYIFSWIFPFALAALLMLFAFVPTWIAAAIFGLLGIYAVSLEFGPLMPGFVSLFKMSGAAVAFIIWACFFSYLVRSVVRVKLGFQAARWRIPLLLTLVFLFLLGAAVAYFLSRTMRTPESERMLSFGIITAAFMVWFSLAALGSAGYRRFRRSRG